MKKLTQEEANIRVLNRCKEMNYELIESFVYNDNKTIIKLKCNIDGYIWNAHFKRFLRGDGCPKCAGNSKPSQEEAEFNVSEKCEYLNYELIEPFIYKNNNTILKLRCKKDNHIWKSTYVNFIKKDRKCNICANKLRKINNSYTKEDIINKALDIHKNNYDYSLVIYNGIFNKIKIICNKCGKVFEQTPSSHIYNNSGCPICNNSKGEWKIRVFLEKNNIEYTSQKTFENCKLKRKLRFDFYLPKYNICLEYDGEQHYKNVKKWGGEKQLNLIKERDSIKTNYCIEKHMKLIRIQYKEFNIIENILKKELNL